MRGDSLRDFYAKTLAVIGLGVLAATGAAVDYWPVGEDWPPVSAVAGLRPVVPAVVQNLDRDIPAPRRARRPALPQPFVSAPARPDLTAGVSAPAIALEAAPAPESFVAVENTLPELLLVEVIDLAPPPVVGAAPDSRRLFGEAVRRTRESLSAARLFLSDTFSGVVGAFRKVSPFFATGAVAPAPF